MPGVYKYEEGGATPQGPGLVLPKDSTGEVLRSEDGREYVMYENPTTGEKVKVFGSWNEAPGIRMGEGGSRTQAIDTKYNYPIMQAENGEFVLDEAMLATDKNDSGPNMVYDPKFGRKMPTAKTGNLLAQLGQMGESREMGQFQPNVERGIGMMAGGKTFRYNER